MSAAHIPVMLTEALGAIGLRPGGLYIDATFGAGGYTREILASFPDVAVFAFDRDPTAIRDGAALAAGTGGRLTLVERPFSSLAGEMSARGKTAIDGVVMDIGISSMQVDQAHRGFSFRFDAPLDMRMASEGETAADLVNGASEAHLADILHFYGEERQARPLARAIVRARTVRPIATTRELADLVSRIVRSKPGDIHPATRTFQALRIAVNDELCELVRALHAAEAVLKPGGSLVVVSFHSLEDRLVKQFMAGRSGKTGGSRHLPAVKALATFRLPAGQPFMPEADEVDFNPRARSARLRYAIRSDEPAADLDAALLARASLPASTPNRTGKR